MNKIIQKALDQLEDYDIPHVSFVTLPYVIFDSENDILISQHAKKPKTVHKEDTDGDISFTTSLGTISASTSTGTITINTVTGQAVFSIAGDEIQLDFDNGTIHEGYLKGCIVNNGYTLNDLVEELHLEEKQHVLFLISDGSVVRNNFVGEDLSDGIFHFRDKSSRKVHLWHVGI